ncbi:MAG: group 1 truncated hemoglobin [bacterium]|jgi:truncated hemoglobin YjbI|nr:group 1 truncated hemoglobin [Planctomycetota bacterium]HIL50735.1 group 1 truncated hemoglobin [Planctomycetota bacterium]
MLEPESVYSQVGGTIQIRRVQKIFYDKIYAHPWLSRFFEDIDQDLIESQQTDFISKTLGGPSVYYGALPVPAHMHIRITGELFDLRSQLLAESLREAGIPEEAAAIWLERDEAFRTRLVKGSRLECKKRYTTDEILDFPQPESWPEGRQAG